MKRLATLILSFLFVALQGLAQQSERVDINEATSAITSTINALNSLFTNLSKAGEVDADINKKIRSISSMAIPCREAIINANYNARSMSEDKKVTIVTIAKDIENQVTTIDHTSTKETILSNLHIAEKKMTELMKTLGIKIKKNKKK